VAPPPAAEHTFSVRLDVAGTGESSIDTGLPILDDLLALAVRTARFDLELASSSDGPPVERRVEAAGEVLGEELAKALTAPGVRGLGDASAPADEALAHVAVEASGRPLVVSNVDLTSERLGGLRRDLLAGFLDAVADAGGLTIHVRLLHGEDTKHVLDAVAKAFGLALAQACSTRPPP
jgi:imidazoleglycerol-phosphate dehydratase